MKTYIYTLSYIFITNIFIILYGITALSRLAIDEINFSRCAEEFFAIMLTYIGCIIVVLIICINCLYHCFDYTLNDIHYTQNTQHIVYQRPLNIRMGLLILLIIVVNIWNCTIAINRSSQHRYCVSYYKNTHESIIVLNQIMAGNALTILIMFVSIWITKKCRQPTRI